MRIMNIHINCLIARHRYYFDIFDISLNNWSMETTSNWVISKHHYKYTIIKRAQNVYPRLFSLNFIIFFSVLDYVNPLIVALTLYYLRLRFRCSKTMTNKYAQNHSPFSPPNASCSEGNFLKTILQRKSFGKSHFGNSIIMSKWLQTDLYCLLCWENSNPINIGKSHFA